MNQKTINQISSQDILEDYEEFNYLLSDALEKSKSAKIKVKSNQYQLKSSFTKTKIDNYLKTRWQTIVNIRELLKTNAIKCTADEWQSPSFNHHQNSHSGNLSGSIKHTINDYKRDQHQLATLYEKKFKSEYLGNKLSLNSLATNSGMSAFTTITHYLKNQLHIDTVLLGKRSYFELKNLVSQTFSNTIEFDESKLSTLPKLINTHQPKAIFIDSISNDPSTFFLNLKYFINKLGNQKLIVVLDNTVSAFYQHQIFKRKNIDLIYFESLNKYHQYGLDMVTGGVIYSTNKHIRNLHKLRMHLGTNIEDYSSLVIPSPNKKILEKRLSRISRNTRFIQKYIQDNLVSKNINISSINKDSEIAPYFVINTKKSIKFKVKFYQKVYQQSKKQNIEIIGGTSFGLSTSRLYLTALKSNQTTPFIRFSPGTETLRHTQEIAKLLTHVINKS